jgi:hypothetical protein
MYRLKVNVESSPEGQLVDLGPGLGSVENGGTLDADLTEEQVESFKDHPHVTLEEVPDEEPVQESEGDQQEAAEPTETVEEAEGGEGA